MAKFTVKSRVKRNGKYHDAGVKVELNDEEAQPLLEAGAIEAGKPEKPEK